MRRINHNQMLYEHEIQYKMYKVCKKQPSRPYILYSQCNTLDIFFYIYTQEASFSHRWRIRSSSTLAAVSDGRVSVFRASGGLEPSVFLDFGLRSGGLG